VEDTQPQAPQPQLPEQAPPQEPQPESSTMPAMNPHIAHPSENPRGYPPFNLSHLSTYTNNQIRYYLKSGALLNTNMDEYKKRNDERNAWLEITKWDGNTRENSPVATESGMSTVHPPPVPTGTRVLSFNDDSEDDSDCPTPPPGYKGIKFSASDIPQLRYPSTVAQFNNWLRKLKSAFTGDPAKYPTSAQKIIFASMTIDEELQTSYDSVVQDYPALTTHWRKFKRWIKNVALQGNADQLKISNDFTTTRQRVDENPHQFYNRLYNLGMQSGRTISIEDYRTRLVKPLQNLIHQHNRNRTYPDLQELVADAGWLWQSLNPDKVRQEIKEDKERAYRERHPGKQSDRKQRSKQPDRGEGSSRDQRRQSKRSETRQDTRQDDTKPRLSTDEQQHRVDNNLCFNCGYPGHRKNECTYPFNPNRVAPKNDNQAKAQPLRSKKRPRAKAQPVNASDHEDADSVVHTTEDSDYDEREIRPSKRSKN